MKYRLLDLLCSVPEGGQLRVANVRDAKTVEVGPELRRGRCKQFCAFKNCSIQGNDSIPNSCEGCYSQEIIEGELVADSGTRYLVIGGIPRILSQSTSDFVRKNQESFSLEWKYFQFGERNWGQDIEFRRKLFLKALGQEPADLRGRLILDAGCGSGLLAIDMANTFDMEVVGLDLARGIENAYKKNNNPRVHFVQGSVLEPPIRKEAVDYVYCAGVLVAIPDTRTGFDALSKCVKRGGTYFIWLYHPMERHRQTGDYTREALYDWIRRRVTSPMPIRLQEAFYLSLLPFYFLKRSIMNPFRKLKEQRTWREKMQGFVDHFSPMYMHRHTEKEALKWYEENGFENATVSYKEQYGFGVRGDRKAP
jgi:ubiquinone/menaquinone biosynthesis C-methylase UbiE/uncharacterized protein YbaR (Trm112 family)